jgi:hypothetical protein
MAFSQRRAHHGGFLQVERVKTRQGVWRDASSFVSIVEVFRIRVSELLIFVNEFR